MRKISKDQIIDRVKLENTWWGESGSIPDVYLKWTPRPYLELLAPLVEQTEIKRSVVLMGPRRVGKSVIIHHLIDRLIKKGINPISICYFSVDHPIYTGLSLEEFVKIFQEIHSIDILKEKCYILFDEIQYLKKWEVHLKSLTDTYPNIKFLVSGSAAAALKLKSTESGAGRFTDFLLPPLTFYEYLYLLNKENLVIIKDANTDPSVAEGKLPELNNRFIDYLNYGGYPEVIFSKEIKSDPGRFIKSDIIDKVLLRDLPQLYGIHDIQELNQLFTNLAFNTAGEVSLEGLSQTSGIAKNTIKKYIEYFEAAFLIKVVHRVDKTAKRLKRATTFKVYLTNPSMHAALFSPVSDEDQAMGSLVETAIFSQWFHQEKPLFYARWKNGEVDIVHLNRDMTVNFAVETKWSDRFYNHPEDLKSLREFCEKQKITYSMITTKTLEGNKKFGSLTFNYIPAALYCYLLGYYIIKMKNK